MYQHGSLNNLKKMSSLLQQFTGYDPNQTQQNLDQGGLRSRNNEMLQSYPQPSPATGKRQARKSEDQRSSKDPSSIITTGSTKHQFVFHEGEEYLKKFQVSFYLSDVLAQLAYVRDEDPLQFMAN